jgi:hypothetical protein
MRERLRSKGIASEAMVKYSALIVKEILGTAEKVNADTILF